MFYEVKTRAIHDTSGLYSQGDITDRPCPAVTCGVGGLNSCHYKVEYYITDSPPLLPERTSLKPPYHVPDMSEIAALPWNGYNVISTFSGCGGSCLGFKMAGYRILWANEFIPAAQETYRVNHVGTILDTRDIREVQPEEIIEAIGGQEIDVLEGSPPCAAFSTAGKREAGWGKVKKYSDTTQRVDDLFFEYARLLRGLQPKVFIAENVSGLVKGTAKGYFLEILAALKDCGYRVKAQVLDAQWLGVPQMRQRVIFQGVRDDLGLAPVYPKPLAYRYSVREALPWIVAVRKGEEFGHYRYDNASAAIADTIGTQSSSGNNKDNTAHTVEAECDISRFAIGKEWAKIGAGGQSDKYFQLTRPRLDGQSGTITAEAGNARLASVTHPTECRKFSIAELKRICAFPDDFILTGTYSQQWERLGRSVPPVMMFYIARAVQEGVLDHVGK